MESPFFKRWFGDWDTIARVKAVRALTPVEAAPPERAAVGKAGIKESFRSFGDVRNARDGRVVKFSSEIAGKVRVQSGVRDVSRFVPVLKKTFEKSIHAFSEDPVQIEGHREHRNVLEYLHYVGKVSHDGTPYFVRFTVPIERKALINNIHASTISEVEIYAESTEGGTVIRPRSQPGGDTAPPFVDIKLAQWLVSVNPADVSKVVDENGKPQVVYHATDADFNVFDLSRAGEKTSQNNVGETDRKNKLHFPVSPLVSQLLITSIMSTFSAHEPPGTAGSCSATRGKCILL